MKRTFLLIGLINIVAASDQGNAVKDKERYYAVARRVMFALSNQDGKQKRSSFAAMKTSAASNLYVETSSELRRVSSEDNADSEWKLLSKEDFEPTTATDTLE